MTYEDIGATLSATAVALLVIVGTQMGIKLAYDFFTLTSLMETAVVTAVFSYIGLDIYWEATS